MLDKKIFRAMKEIALKKGKCPMMTWTFAVGIGWVRTVTVRARGYEDAFDLAETKCDELDAKAGRESPVAHTLFLIDARWKP
jgi:hypothetical protein